MRSILYGIITFQEKQEYSDGCWVGMENIRGVGGGWREVIRIIVEDFGWGRIILDF